MRVSERWSGGNPHFETVNGRNISTSEHMDTLRYLLPRSVRTHSMSLTGTITSSDRRRGRYLVDHLLYPLGLRYSHSSIQGKQSVTDLHSVDINTH